MSSYLIFFFSQNMKTTKITNLFNAIYIIDVVTIWSIFFLTSLFLYSIQAFKRAETPIINSRENGAFLDSCLTHCHAESDTTWNKMTVDSQTIRETFGDWYFKRSGKGKVVDCAYPCNTSC